MSSFPQHELNMIELEKLGLDVSDYKDSNGDFYESWNYDSLTYIVQDCIELMKQPKLTAAPDMYEALIKAVEYIEPYDPEDYELIAQCNKALSKADGKG